VERIWKMNIKLHIRGEVDTIELEKVMQEITKKEIKKVSAKGFGGIDTLVYILSIGGGVVITQLANVIVKIIEKNNIHEVTINGINIKGYSFKQTESLLNDILIKEDSIKEDSIKEDSIKEDEK
jgi:hypothetical protein